MTPKCAHAGPTCHAVCGAGIAATSFLSRIATLLTLISLVLTAVVPQGMMRVADGDGVRLLLCTEDGPREIWLGSGEGPSEPVPVSDDNRESTKCLAVTICLAAVQAETLSDAGLADFARFRPVLTSAFWPGFAVDPSRAPRAPPVFSALA
ncbi:MAG: hypothetical protein ACK4NE_00785 [Albidovulum sp.]